tara:strand:+ start:886 stop:1626 length:741 start_codon:yes stop_codon:yes gene_type:complete
MINKIYIKFLLLIIGLIDNDNKKKIILFFKQKLKKDFLNILDIGAHKGETIDLFFENFNINKILAFEANPVIYNKLKKKIKKRKYLDKIYLFNHGLGEKVENKELSIFNDSSSSTYNTVNKDTNYYKRKEKFLSFLKFNKSVLHEKLETKIYPLSAYKEMEDLKTIDILKIDTEGFELNILKGINVDHFKKIKFIYFEHHYDLMIKKNYTYSDIKSFLNQNNFYLSLRLKMKFRKTFEYVYENKRK